MEVEILHTHDKLVQGILHDSPFYSQRFKSIGYVQGVEDNGGRIKGHLISFIQHPVPAFQEER